MGKAPEDRGFKFEWERKVAECRLGAATKSVAAWLSHHANSNGTNAHPGLRRLVHETELSERTVRRCLEQLREIGLIVRTLKGSTAAKRNFADAYDLAIPADLEARVRLESKPDSRRTGRGRGGMANHVRWHDQRGKFEPSCIHCAEAQEQFGPPRGAPRDGATPLRPPAKRTPTTGQTDPDHRSVEQYHQASTTKPSQHHAARPSAGARASSRAASSFAAYDFINESVGGLDPVEASTTDAMLADGAEPKAVINRIRKMREAA
ncbi:hypothetical protein GCM10023085_44700 [Actinomadura viridis]|uniref:Helix-turn-helix domain-containing protein n=1 Tax=Actinomadura viridis TaxID=58110 RepID=A0A931DLM0_9ACTN|nr:helix-turn-helix domain-containing protein [Actinomadura viridis]MBG6089831.1 hypothetical protein [Actinomadura viridis]